MVKPKSKVAKATVTRGKRKRIEMRNAETEIEQSRKLQAMQEEEHMLKKGLSRQQEEREKTKKFRRLSTEGKEHERRTGSCTAANMLHERQGMKDLPVCRNANLKRIQARFVTPKPH
nr:hypothetical protein Iba_chr12cCG12850 [Ipomoea batatas]